MKASIQKTTAEQEIIILEIPAKDPAELGIRLREGLRILDERCYEMGQRVIAAHTVMQTLDPAVRAIIHSVHSIHYGQATQESVAMIDAAKKVLAERVQAKADAEPTQEIPSAG